MEKQIIRIHRVGSVTFGILLVLTGILFLGRLFLPRLNYEAVLHFWPLILISLGVEVLLGCTRKTYEIRNENGRLLQLCLPWCLRDFPSLWEYWILRGEAVRAFIGRRTSRRKEYKTAGQVQ